MTTETTKPRLRRCLNGWLCFGDNDVGWAETRTEAYCHWMRQHAAKEARRAQIAYQQLMMQIQVSEAQLRMAAEMRAKVVDHL